MKRVRGDVSTAAGVPAVDGVPAVAVIPALLAVIMTDVFFYFRGSRNGMEQLQSHV